MIWARNVRRLDPLLAGYRWPGRIDGRRIIARGENGLAHRNALSVGTVERLRVEAPRHSAAAEKCRFEAHAFFFGKRNDLQGIGQRRSGANGGQADRRLRPRARRAFRTLRPPTVSMRARNPCRRLRTSLLG